MKTLEIKGKAVYKMLMLIASKIHESGHRAYRAESEEYEILVTIRVKGEK